MSEIIIDRGGCPRIAGTRITVFDILDYSTQGWHHSSIALTLHLSSAQVLSALEYIDQHKDQVMADYQTILDRVPRADSSEEKRKARKRRLLLVKQLIEDGFEGKREDIAETLRSKITAEPIGKSGDAMLPISQREIDGIAEKQKSQ